MIAKHAILAVIGGFVYSLIEIACRGYTHWSMFILGGICFLAVGALNECLPWDLPFWAQMLSGGLIITALELVTGFVCNVWLGWAVWDYSDEWLNLYGQICPKYAVIWVMLSGVAIVLDDYLRYWLFREKKPKYKLF